MQEETLQPVQSPIVLDGIWSESRERQLVLFFLILGILARCVRYFLCFPLWEDECFLCTNFIDRDYLQLLRPLNYHQVAPLLFLWLELAVTHLLGFTEFALRVVPFITGIASLFLFWHLCKRLLQGPALVFAVAVFAVAYPCIRYSAEAKPYGTDLFFSLLLFVLAAEWWRKPEQLRWPVAMTLLIPLAVGISYPAVFTGGGISAFFLWRIVRLRQWRRLLPWAIYSVTLLLAFGIVYFVSIRPQSSSELSWMRDCWQSAFPPLTSVPEFLVWVVREHSSCVLAYPVGGENGASTLTLLLVLAAIAFLAVKRRLQFLTFAFAPLLLHFVAAAMRRYPYGMHVKYSQYIAPMICLLFGIGLATAVAWTLRRGRSRQIALYGWVTALSLLGVGCIVRDLMHPYKSRTDLRARAFAQWFWFNAEFDSEVVCMKSDLGIDFSPATFSELSWSAMYLCNQRIYSPRHHLGGRPNWNAITQARPLRIVQYKAGGLPYDQAAFEAWLADFQKRYRLVDRDRFAFPNFRKNERQLLTVDHIEIYTFVPLRTDAGIVPVIQSGRGM